MGGEAAERQNPRFFVAVHVGAGYHAPSNEKALRSAMKRACVAAASILRKGPGHGGCVDAVAAAIQVLEVKTVKPHFSLSCFSNYMSVRWVGILFYFLS